MVERYYEIARRRILVHLPQDVMYTGDGPLASFAAEPGAWDLALELCIVPELSAPAGKLIYRDPGKRIYLHDGETIRYNGAVDYTLDGAIARIHRKGNRSIVQVLEKSIPFGITASVILNAMEVDHLMVRTGGIILHASYIIHDGKAILFTAPSGTGKSTQAALWERYRDAKTINGDRTVLLPSDAGVMAYGLPFAGSSGICENQSAPVKAIVYLTQAPVNSVEPMKGLRAFGALWEGVNLCRWDEDDLTLASDMVLKIISEVPIYRLACTPDVRAVEVLARILYQN